MKLLYIANSPTLMSPSTDALNSILNCNKDDEITVLYLGSKDLESKNNVRFIHYECDLDKTTLPSLLKGKHFLRFVSYFCKKIINKINFSLHEFNFYEAKALRNKACELINKENFDRVVVFETFSRERSNLIKKYLRKIHSKTLIYWLEMPIKKTGKFDYKYFNKISSFCHKSCIHSRYNELIQKDTKITNVVNVEYPITTLDYNNYGSKPEKTLIYLGKMYKSIRNPEYLFKIMDKLSDYKLLVFGAGETYKLDNQNVSFMDAKPLKELYETIEKSSGLVCIENNLDTVRKTSKLATYIPFKKPIIDIVKNEQIKPSLDLEGYKYGFVKINETDLVDSSVSKIIEVLQNQNSNGKDVSDYETMFPNYIFNQFKNI